MTTQQISHRLQTVLAHCGSQFTALTDQTTFRRDLGLDSLDVTDLLVRVEDEFSIRIPDEDWCKLKIWGLLKGYIVDVLCDQRSYPVRPATLQWLAQYGPSL